MSATKKVCTGCGAKKELEEFHKRAASKDGRYAECRACVRGRNAANYARAKANPKPCKIEGCQKDTEPCRSYCAMHRQRLRRHGEAGGPEELVRLQRDITYGGAHLRIERARGKASSHPCAFCGKPAEQWALSHDLPPDRFEGRDESRLAYSVNPNRYIPLCRPEHLEYDRTALPEVDCHALHAFARLSGRTSR